MPLMTQLDRIAIVQSHCESIKRTLGGRGDPSGLPEFWKAIADIATEAIDLSAPATPLTPSP